MRCKNSTEMRPPRKVSKKETKEMVRAKRYVTAGQGEAPAKVRFANRKTDALKGRGVVLKGSVANVENPLAM